MKLLFIYNADGGFHNDLIGLIHKTISPETYACSLCAITYGGVRMDPRWRAWLRSLPHQSVFLHRNEFVRAYPGTQATLPTVFFDENGMLHSIMTSSDLAAVADVPALIALLEARLAQREAVAVTGASRSSTA